MICDLESSVESKELRVWELQREVDEFKAFNIN